MKSYGHCDRGSIGEWDICLLVAVKRERESTNIYLPRRRVPQVVLFWTDMSDMVMKTKRIRSFWMSSTTQLCQRVEKSESKSLERERYACWLGCLTGQHNGEENEEGERVGHCDSWFVCLAGFVACQYRGSLNCVVFLVCRRLERHSSTAVCAVGIEKGEKRDRWSLIE